MLSKASYLLPLIACQILLAGSLNAATMLIDFGLGSLSDTTGKGPTTGLAQTWNNYTDTSGATNLALVDTSNLSTAIILSTSGSFNVLNEAANPIGAPYPNIAAGDAFFNNPARTLTFSGLDPLLTYNITVYGYANRSDSRLTNVNINGVIQSYEPSNTSTGNLDGGFVTFTGLVPNASNQIALTLTTSTGNYILNVIELTSVPEPSRALLLTTGLLLSFRRHRHRPRQ
ncbi:PEP-CTERM sorting domain-containing protein [Phragmitibacter flavus]|uniref:PEP-CTERM sorting domain-containing protein n=1 Tax=Phragmitibacter flavus TaxID=2576071 RepID=A0A5R8K7A8_9BACT|nr:PEP-CTERM sorting domain-containing protein [Phragmitibacter flavus]TLD68246.1 PEP-CTERM sorting domain-containing protein [Phragmitibacter flavus]